MTPLETEIRRRIALAGPMPVRQFMTLCLTHPEHGYYMTRDPLGRAGDFVTAPEVSQMFGELIGLWAAAVWHAMGQPENVRLVELGPGRGTMMLDALRAAQVVPAFRTALVVHLIEISPALRAPPAGDAAGARRADALARRVRRGAGRAGHRARQRVLRRAAGPSGGQADQRLVRAHGRASTHDGNLAFSIADEPIPLFDQLLPPQVRDAPLGSLFEWRPDNLALEIGRRVMREGGAALVIDYGHVESAPGETLQAVGRHGFADPLGTPGEVDLTAHVDFQALALAAESMGVRVHGPLEQAEFLRRMGIERRAAALKASASAGARRPTSTSRWRA